MCMDYVVSSYTPTLSALVRARRGAIPLDTSKARMLLIGESSATIEGTNRLPALPNIRHELSEIANVAIRQRMQHISTQRDKTTIMQVSQALPFADIVHLACHGIQDHQNALASSFCLGDGKLSISEIMDLNMSRKFLAFLSACETAKGDEEQPDQVLHLAASMLFTGFRSVVATMW
jgi:CHAT domain-containing protein